jgi:hypothetical protein
MRPDLPLGAATTITRRQLLRSGLALGAFLLPTPWPTWAAVASGRRKAKGVILVLLEGGMSHLETWDPKPSAPAEIRGEFQTIATTVPGLRIGEYMPRLAQQAHLYNVIRSVHCDARNDHSPGMHLVLTGYENPSVGVALERTNREHPSQGAIIAQRLGVTSGQGVPRFVALPQRMQVGGRVTFASPAFLGAAYEAFETGPAPATASQPMQLPPSLLLPKDVPLERLGDRLALQSAFNRLNSVLDRDPAVSRMDTHYQRALTILSGQRMSRALDIHKEPQALRDRYGDNRVGQTLLLARRLAEAGVTYVLADPYGKMEWDTHAQNFAGHRKLLPPMDQAVSALLADLQQRGLLDEILVLLISEMGRTPLIGANAGRDHWTSAYSVMMAGGGLTRGQVVGSTTAGGQKPGSRPVTVPEILATVYHQLGINPNTLLYDETKRPVPILPEAKPIHELFA